MRWISLLAAGLALSECSKGSRTACYGLTDRELLESIQSAYANHGQELERDFRLNRERVVGVERVGKQGYDAFTGMIFRQNNGAILSIRLFEDFTYQTSRGKNADPKNWAYPLATPKF